MQPEYTTAVSRQSEHTRLWRWVIYKGSVEFRAGLSNTQKAAQSDADACLKNFQTPAVELTQRKPVVINLIRQATLSARQRTGDKSIGTRVKQGKFQIVSVTYRAGWLGLN